MVARRTTFRLYPNRRQEAVLFRWRRLHTYLYNSALADRRESYRRSGVNVSYFDQQNRLPAFKEVWPEYEATNVRKHCGSLRQLGSMKRQKLPALWQIVVHRPQ